MSCFKIEWHCRQDAWREGRGPSVDAARGGIVFFGAGRSVSVQRLAALGLIAIGVGVQRPVSATDFFYTGAGCPVGSCGFNTPENWTPGGGPPGDGDTATIDMDDNIMLTADTGVINELHIGGGATLRTGVHQLNVLGGVPGFTEVVENSALLVGPSAAANFVTDILSLRQGGELRMTLGTAAARSLIRVDTTSSITGSGIIGLTVGTGVVLELAGVIRPRGELYIIAPMALLDLDGNSAGADLGGLLDVVEGNLHVDGALADPFSGRINIGNNGSVEFSLPLPFDGEINVTSGTINLLIAPTITFQNGAVVTVHAGDAWFRGTVSFLTGSSVHLLNVADDLLLDGDSTIASGVSFTGNGFVRIASGDQMTLLDGAAVGVRLLTIGTSEVRLGVASTIADATLGGYQQDAFSDLRIDLGGVALNQYDHMAITGDASLNGSLFVALVNGFALSKGQQFEILDIGGIRTGTFSGLAEGAEVGSFPVELFITYNGGDGNDVVLFTKGFTADFDNDNDIDGADFLIWQQHVGTSSGAVNGDGDADGDADVDGDDLAAWKTQYGSVAPVVAAATATPEPAAAMLAVYAGAAIIGLRRKRIRSTAP